MDGIGLQIYGTVVYIIIMIKQLIYKFHTVTTVAPVAQLVEHLK